MPEEFWENFFGLHLGPWGFWIGPYKPFTIRYRRTEKSHLLRIRINPNVKKEEIKARLLEPGLIEIEWPRKVTGEEIPIE